jgi:hypothetical protein
MVFQVRAVASDPPPERFRWEIFPRGQADPIERSPASFRMETTALEAGKRALAKFLRERGKALNSAAS